jgi:hypothetical protein
MVKKAGRFGKYGEQKRRERFISNKAASKVLKEQKKAIGKKGKKGNR